MTTRAPGGAPLVQAAWAKAERAMAAAGVTIRALTDLPDISDACLLLDRVWDLGPDDLSENQPPLLRALEHSGNYVVGAFQDGAGHPMVAVSVAFLAAPIGRGLHSHITGVLPGSAGAGVGAAIKWHQRAWALERGLDTISWTYDPLIARNAYFNVHRLGARPVEYLADFYGLLTDGLNVGQPSDRALAVWDLNSAVVELRAAGPGPDGSARDLSGAAVLLSTGAGGEPIPGPAGSGADVFLIAIPADVEALRRTDPKRALSWRMELRRVLGPMLAGPDWQVTDFLRSGWYVLSPAGPLERALMVRTPMEREGAEQ